MADLERKTLLRFKDLPFSRTTAWRMIRRGRLRCYRINRRVFFDQRHLDEFLQSCETGNDPQN